MCVFNKRTIVLFKISTSVLNKNMFFQTKINVKTFQKDQRYYNK